MSCCVHFYFLSLVCLLICTYVSVFCMCVFFLIWRNSWVVFLLSYAFAQWITEKRKKLKWKKKLSNFISMLNNVCVLSFTLSLVTVFFLFICFIYYRKQMPRYWWSQGFRPLLLAMNLCASRQRASFWKDLRCVRENNTAKEDVMYLPPRVPEVKPCFGGGWGGTLGICGCGCAARTLEVLAYTRTQLFKGWIALSGG